MFKRQADFRDYLRMVVTYISDEDHAITLSGDRGKMVKWPQEYRAYQEAMTHEDRMAVSSFGLSRLLNTGIPSGRSTQIAAGHPRLGLRSAP